MAKQKELFGSSGGIYVQDAVPVHSHSGSSHKCYTSHPPYKLPGTDFVVYGGSCISPAVSDADIYIGFDHGMHMMSAATPWGGPKTFYVPVPDMGVPADVPMYKAYVAWVWDQIKAGKKVHCGCIGGHGRTGMFLAALCKHATGHEDAIAHVRANYCQKAVESARQIDFLYDNFGIKKVEPSKKYTPVSSGKETFAYVKDGGYKPKKSSSGFSGKSSKVFKPVVHGCLWRS